ncbi:pyridoxal phosphate-dependent aminotransferase [Lutimaribacter sp. EGI FJ00015]|uniref:Pyridoxal phosphate-dependent aminotransferase n=1 Tax=Lutimaribacter degradans TaxID=2945989 RepID=A0ACC5ZSE6_9RHOB|nr:pyridoxal phosphate-dependent aminotransferase [Lutimaribacter sp. EGI FJ00013]MCM2561060.1 pyridoxal phosphate-dependent aminotransferase [Lutimaribacter sp. EGI FJ00013]MCO0611992.1 pyridoxal phosphate-dependent aminotransferase [Lutimaribacter sp. EGI FJ00015]MCO0634888.1 pyridoxal phosphate-dependent aminotransferase [Lutimaribacter sp. EGI FJ00014]
MELSQRITRMIGKGGDGWDLFFKARAMADVGQPVVELTIGEHDIRTDPRILAAMDRAARGGHTGYAMMSGTDDLRDAVAARVQARTGVPTARENVLITPGGQSGLFAAHHAVCDDGDRALFIDPYYATYPGTIRAIGAQAVPVQARAEDAFQPRADDLAAAAPGAKSLLVNTPNNPTGAVYSRATLDGITRVCQKHDLWLISDEVYDTQVWDGAHLSPRALPGMAERTLVVGSMSKSHAMTGSRIGWLVGPRRAIAHLASLAIHTTYGVPGFIQDAALFALNEGPALEQEIAAPFARRRAIAMDILGRQNAIRALPPQGAMYMMLDIRATGLSGLDFAERLLAQHMIAVMPGESFGQAPAGHIRVALTVADARFAEAFQTLVDMASELAT